MNEKFYRSLYKIRRVEQEIASIYPTDKIKSPVHLSIGQEAISVGVCQALRLEDIVFGTYRGHALYLAKGGDLKPMIAELFGKVSGVSQGRGGSMHLIDTKVGVMGTSAIVASTIPQAVGYAYAAKVQKKDIVVVSFFGDGAVEEGCFHESLNFATIKNLPIIFVCENNFYAIHSHLSDRQPSENIASRVESYGIPVRRVEDGDINKIYDWSKEAVSDIREQQGGPRFLECLSYRWMGHVGPDQDFDIGYRLKSEAQEWLANDQVEMIGSLLDYRRRSEIESEIDNEISEAFAFAEESEFPSSLEL